MTNNAEDLRRLAVIRDRINRAAHLKMLEPKNLAKGSWKVQTVNREVDAYLQKRAREELDEFIKNPSYSESGDVLNFMAMLIDNAITEAST